MLTRCFVLLYLSLFGCSLLFSQSTRPQVQQYKILGISVEGNKSAETPAIIANSGLKLGDEITVPGEQTRTAITRLWALRIFSDVEIDIENTIGTGVFLLIKVKEHPRLDKTVITGEDDISEDDLLKKVNLLKGQILTPEEISRIIKTIKKAYEDDGYLQASIKA
jgi:outer membrane protein insertion porin family